jgi:hypothetical protein
MSTDTLTDRLSEAYAPFLPVLERLSEPLQQLVEGLLVQFERLAADFDARDLAPQGEFEGLGGITTRGDLAHLLQSELLLRTEAPHEFLRRLAESETLFLEKHFADPGAKPLHRAMISVGPGLLGHGRIVALAAIFFLARVARMRGAAFHWCFLPRADGPIWFDTLSINTVKRFLRAASNCEMTTLDVAEADRVWDRLMEDTPGPSTTRRLDWVIGAAPDVARDPGLAIVAAANSLSFSLNPPVFGAFRSAHVAARRGARARGCEIVFPDDRRCVAALDNPFRAPLGADGASGPAALRPPSEGWEPQHLIVPNTRVRIVRMPDGLLVLGWAGKGRFNARYFVPIPADVHLVGVRMQGTSLSLVLHIQRSGAELLRFGRYSVLPGQLPKLLFTASKSVPSEHLFRKRSRAAIPPLNVEAEIEFYAHSGQAYHLTAFDDDAGVRLVPLHKAPRTLFCEEPYRVIRVEQDGATMLRVLRKQAARVDDYPVADGVAIPERLLGMVYSGSTRGLAYSIVPDVWTVPPALAQADGAVHSLTVASHESLLAAQAIGGGVNARLWSDTRYGGDGVIRTIRQQDGETVARGAPLDLGADARSIVKVALGDDGVWALTHDQNGVPAEILKYRQQRRNQRYDCMRFSIADLRAQSEPIDLALCND